MAGNATIGALRVVLGADTAALEKGLKDAQGGLSSFGNAVQIGMAAAAAAVAAAAASIVGSITTAIDTADKLNKMSQSTGVAVEELSKLKYAADLSDVSLESLGKSLGKLSKALVSAASDGASQAGRAFAAMGVEVKNASDGSIRPASDVLADIAGKFAGYKDGAEKTSLAIALFGKAGAAMIPLLNQGKDGLKEAGAEAEKFGLVLDKQTTLAAEAFNDNLKKLDLVKQGLYLTISAKLLPTLEQLSAQFLETKKNSDFTATAADLVTTAIRVLGREVALAAVAFHNAASEFVGLKNLLSETANSTDFGAAAWAKYSAILENNEKKLSDVKATFGTLAANLDSSSFVSRFSEMSNAISATTKETKRLQEESKKTSAPIVGEMETAKNAVLSFLDAQTKRIAGQTAEAATVGKSVGEQAKLRVEYEAQAIAAAKNIPLTETLRAKISAVGDAAALAAQKLQGAQLIEQTAMPWDQRAQQVQQYTAAMTAAGASADQLAIMTAKIQFPAFSAASVAASDFGMQIDNLATGAVNSLSSNLAALITGTKTAAEAFKAFAVQIIADIAAMIIKMLIFKAIRTAVFGFSDGGMVGGTGFSLTGTGGLFADGGFVSGSGSATSDSIPAMLSNGEFVINADATKKWGPLLAAINSGKVPSFADGGEVGTSMVGQAKSSPTIVNVAVPIATTADALRSLIDGLNGMFRDGYKLNVVPA